jgi:hypothetical protein
MVYYVEQRADGLAVIGRGNDRSANIKLSENDADRRAHELAGPDGYVGWKDIHGRFVRWCPCTACKNNRG